MQCTSVQSEVLRSHVVRLYVCLSATVDCYHIGWKSWKLIAQTISPTPSRSVNMYLTHTHGTQLCPLTCISHNNKPCVSHNNQPCVNMYLTQQSAVR